MRRTTESTSPRWLRALVGGLALSAGVRPTHQTRIAPADSLEVARFDPATKAAQPRQHSRPTHVLTPPSVGGASPLSSYRGASRIGELAYDDLRLIVDEVAVDVRRETGWQLSLENLKLRIATRDDVMSTYPKATSEDEKSCTQLAAYLGAGFFVPKRNVLAIAQTFARAATWDALRQVVYHELVHVAQFQHNPALFAQRERSSAALREATAAHGDTSREAQLAARHDAALLGSIEGHAAAAEDAARHLYPGSNVDSPRWLRVRGHIVSYLQAHCPRQAREHSQQVQAYQGRGFAGLPKLPNSLWAQMSAFISFCNKKIFAH